MYIALRCFEGRHGKKYRAGDAVPEALEWHNPVVWERSGAIRWVPDNEIENGRWRQYSNYAAGSAVPSAPESPAAPVVETKPAPVVSVPVVETKPAPAAAPKVEEKASKLDRAKLLMLPREDLVSVAEETAGVAIDSSMTKEEIVDTLLQFL